MVGEEDLARQLRLARSEGGSFRLPPRLLLRLTGADAFRYLNGQVTRDLMGLGRGEALSACILTPKGRLCAPLLIRRGEIGEDLIIESVPELRESLMERLERYVVADDVGIVIESDPGGLHCFGKPEEEIRQGRGGGIMVSRLGMPGRDLEVDHEMPADSQPLLDPRVVEVLRIERRIPRWGSELSPETLPPEVGLDRTHIDYGRGCYPGQEVISRLRSIGRVNRCLTLLTAAAEASVAPGTPLVGALGEQLGAVTSSAIRWDTGGRIALGYLPRVPPESVFALDPLTGCRAPISIVPDHAP